MVPLPDAPATGAGTEPGRRRPGPAGPYQVALLRGVNVGGRSALPMAELRELCTSLGLADVTTYLQSGNVIFRAMAPVDPADLATAIAHRFGLGTTVALRTGAELAAVVAANPFPDAGGTALHVAFLEDEPDVATVGNLDTGRYAPEAVVVRGRELYFHLPAGMGTAKLPAYVGRRLAVPTTVRNWRTVTALARLAAG